MTRSRRSVLATLAGGAALLSGCGSTEQPETATGERGTPTVTFTTRTATDSPTDTATASETATDAETATDSTTETPDSVDRALTAAREDIGTAIQRLDAAAVVENGEVGLVSEDAFAEYARTDDPRPPVRAARRRLDAVSDRAGGDRQRAVNGLLFLCEYLEVKAAEHDDIVDGFSSAYQANRAFPGELKLADVEGAAGNMRDLQSHVSTAREVLGRVERRADALDVAGFAPGAARETQRTFRAIGREFEPAFAGTLSTMRAVGLVSATGPAIERGDYGQAEEFATASVTAGGNATERLGTAFDRGVRHFRDVFEQDRCLAGGMQTVGRRYAESARAFREGDSETGRERYRAARDAIGTAEKECGIEL